MVKDKTLTCQDCKKEFTFTAGEQSFFETKGFTNDPKRCPECRLARRQHNQHSSNKQHTQSQQMYTTQCSQCGRVAEVPFEPTNNKPVYCSNCFKQRKRA